MRRGDGAAVPQWDTVTPKMASGGGYPPFSLQARRPGRGGPSPDLHWRRWSSAHPTGPPGRIPAPHLRGSFSPPTSPLPPRQGTMAPRQPRQHRARSCRCLIPPERPALLEHLLRRDRPAARQPPRVAILVAGEIGTGELREIRPLLHREHALGARGSTVPRAAAAGGLEGQSHPAGSRSRARAPGGRRGYRRRIRYIPPSARQPPEATRGRFREGSRATPRALARPSRAGAVPSGRKDNRRDGPYRHSPSGAGTDARARASSARSAGPKNLTCSGRGAEHAQHLPCVLHPALHDRT